MGNNTERTLKRIGLRNILEKVKIPKAINSLQNLLGHNRDLLIAKNHYKRVNLDQIHTIQQRKEKPRFQKATER